MPFIPHTADDIETMLEIAGVHNTESLFDEIPEALRCKGLTGLPPALTEMEVSRLMRARAEQNPSLLCFAGAGAYEHHIPAAVWEIATRGEFYSAYTPYQAEASQGTMQVIYEFQTMMARLTAMDVSNASLYDGASALAEAALMAVRCNTRSKSKRILMPNTVHPVYRQVVETIVEAQGITCDAAPYCTECGHTVAESLKVHEGQDFAALVVPQPNFFGVLEDADPLTDWAHAQGALVIAVVNPVSLALLKPPGRWGQEGADIVCGEGQPLGIPLSFGGPYFGFMCCKQRWVRQMPGRIVGRTEDADGKPGFALTLQTREQHIRRSKATSNICTNQGLMVTAATIHMALLGDEGLRCAAAQCHANTRALVEQLTGIEGVRRVFNRPYFHEQVIRFDAPVEKLMAALVAMGILAGYSLKRHYPELGEALLVCATETRTSEDIGAYVAAVGDFSQRHQSAS
jgi:glycine dehydrogenase subunit 1